MKDYIRHKVIFLILFISICIIYIVFNLLPTRDSFNEDEYLARYLIPANGQKLIIENVQHTTESPLKNITKYEYINELESGSTTDKQNLTITVFKINNDETTIKVRYPETEIKNNSRNVFVEMENIEKSKQNIFFIESRCATEKMAVHFKENKGFVLNARQCCAIESTAQMNLDRNVYIFHSCSLDDKFFQYSSMFVEKLFKYPNVYVVRLNTTAIFLGSPLEEFHRKKLLESSIYPVEHTSDLIRLTLLWKFGGTYCDLDVVTIRSLNNLKTNWAGMQDDVTIANGVINFEFEGAGHRMLQTALEKVNRHYDPSNWSSNGPLLITPIILDECRVKEVPEAQEYCRGNFTVLEKPILYPIYYPSAGDFFDNKLGKQIVSHVKERSYSVHIWNKMSHNMSVTVGSSQAYALLADEYCPQVYRNCGPSF